MPRPRCSLAVAAAVIAATLAVLLHHEELQYSALQADFASMYSVDGDALGIHFRAAAQQAAFSAVLDKAAAAVAPAVPMLWCLNHVSNRRDATVRLAG